MNKMSAGRMMLRFLRRRPVAIALATLLLAFGLLAYEVAEGDTLAWDRSALLMLRTAGNPADPIGPHWLIEAARDVTALGSYSVITLIVAAFGLGFLLKRETSNAIFVASAVVCGTALSSLLKVMFDRPRPDLTGLTTVFTSSFPSGHATMSAVAYLTLGTCLAGTTDNNRLKVFFVVCGAFVTLAVGATRIYLGVHYPTDVIAGWAIGTSWALCCGLAMDGWRATRGASPA